MPQTHIGSILLCLSLDLFVGKALGRGGREALKKFIRGKSVPFKIIQLWKVIRLKRHESKGI